jgi:hypothetical protein
LAPVNGSGREVACWLHRDGVTVPPELALPDPASQVLERAETVARVSEK